MRRIAYVSLTALSIVAAMTSHAWAPPTGVLTPNAGVLTPNLGTLVPNVGALTPNVGALTPNVGAVSPNANVLPPPPPNIPGNYGGLPNAQQANVPIYDAANSALGGFDPPTINYGNLAPDAPRLNYGIIQPEAPNAPMGRLPDNAAATTANQPNLNYGALQPEAPNAPMGQLPSRPQNYGVLQPEAPNAPMGQLPARPQNYGVLQPEAPNAPMGQLPDRPLPLAYGELPSGPSGTPVKQRPADALADLVDLPENHPGRIQANRITNNVGVPNPPMNTPVAAIQNLPPPQTVAGNPPPVPPKTFWQRHKTKFIVGGVIVVVAGAGLSVPIIIEKVTGEEIADTGIPEVDEIVDGLTGGDSASP